MEIVLPELPDVMIVRLLACTCTRRDYLSSFTDGDRLAHMHIKGSNIADGRYIDDPPAESTRSIGDGYSRSCTRGYDGTLSIEPHP